MTDLLRSRPGAEALPDYYQAYLAKLPAGILEVLPALQAQLQELVALTGGLPLERQTYRYEPGKWTVREVVGHLHEGARTFFAEDGVQMLGPNGVTGSRNDIERRASDACWATTVNFLLEKLAPDHQS